MGQSAGEWELGQDLQAEAQVTVLSNKLYYYFMHMELFHYNSGTLQVIERRALH